MNRLALKVPPIVVFIITVLGIAVTGLLLGNTELSLSVRWGWFIVFAVIGSAIAILGVRQFKKAETSFSPRHPNKASAMVSSGIFAYTRNPMYLGMAFVLVGFIGWFGHWQLVIWLLGFIAYLTQFQIKPEERVLIEKFGREYTNYTQRVRRWV